MSTQVLVRLKEVTPAMVRRWLAAIWTASLVYGLRAPFVYTIRQLRLPHQAYRQSQFLLALLWGLYPAFFALSVTFACVAIGAFRF